MTVRHHLSDRLLAAYATGELAEGWSLAVATHLALCPECRSRLRRFEAAAGEMLDELQGDRDDMEGSWAQVRERLTNTDVLPKPVISRPTERLDGAVLPEPLRSYLGGDAHELRWKPLGRGAHHVLIPTLDDETTARLLRIPAGKPVPEHSHGGRELTLVLSGSFSDRTGRFGRGDIEEADEMLEHQPVAGVEEDCICLAVTDAPLRFKSRFLRLIQPVLGI